MNFYTVRWFDHEDHLTRRRGMLSLASAVALEASLLRYGYDNVEIVIEA